MLGLCEFENRGKAWVVLGNERSQRGVCVLIWKVQDGDSARIPEWAQICIFLLTEWIGPGPLHNMIITNRATHDEDSNATCSRFVTVILTQMPCIRTTLCIMLQSIFVLITSKVGSS